MSVSEGQSPSSLQPGVGNEPDTLFPQVVEATAGDYEIIGELGRGGMAAVFLAKDVSLNRKVAIKTMLPELTARHDMVARFKREAQMAAGLSHPHIVQIHSVKQTNRLVYFVMKFIEGRDLVSIISEQGALDLDMTRLVLQQAASALSFAHHRGVVHRDVKPANIMIDENGWAVMTDFGIAKIDDGNNLTATGTTVGTPHYMAPEQFHNQPLTAAADQYALGIVAYEMLSGKKPFDGSTLAEIITQHLFKEPPDITAVRSDLPPIVSETILRMLAKEPDKRFPDLDAAISALGPPDPSQVESARGRLIAFARKTAGKKVRLSVPMSPVPSAVAATVATPVPPTPVPPAPRPVAPPTVPTPVPATPVKRRSALPWVIAASVLFILAIPGYLGVKRVMADRARPENNAALKRGVQMWQQGKGEIAELDFQKAAREMPTSGMPHIYLARLARERGDLRTAAAEAANAARLEPNNALALREVGSVLLARGDYVGARRFFIRALRVNPGDKTAMGWLACSLHRAGDVEQSARWSGRAGVGPWSACFR
jgi:serine/threonine protein kinase